MSVTGFMLFAFAHEVTTLFTNDPDVLRWGTSCLKILGVGFPMYATGMVIVQALNGAGDTGTPVVLNVICFWLVETPLAYTLATKTGLGPNGAFMAIVCAETLLTILSIIVFRRGKWKYREV